MKLSIGAICPGGGSRKNHTGNWRTFRPQVDEKQCSGCGICDDFCPDFSVVLVNGCAVIDLRYCKGCGLCAYECPHEAITMIREGG